VNALARPIYLACPTCEGRGGWQYPSRIEWLTGKELPREWERCERCMGTGTVGAE
jgi:DnaJ-class molecular chaperone